jgi:hypothetical protein
LHRKFRNRLRKSEKEALSIRVEQNIVLFREFIPLYNELVSRKGLSPDLSIELFESVQAGADEKEKYIVSLADHNRKPVAGHVASLLGDSCVSVLAASSTEGRKLNASFSLWWHIIQKGQSLGCLWHDLGGINPMTEPGVYNFKKRMGGQEISVVP